MVDGEMIDTRPRYLQNSVDSGIRMVTPAGTLCLVPEENVAAAEADGARVIRDEDLAMMFNRMFLAQKFFEEKHPKVTNWRLPRGKGRW